MSADTGLRDAVFNSVYLSRTDSRAACEKVADRIMAHVLAAHPAPQTVDEANGIDESLHRYLNTRGIPTPTAQDPK